MYTDFFVVFLAVSIVCGRCLGSVIWKLIVTGIGLGRGRVVFLSVFSYFSRDVGRGFRVLVFLCFVGF